MYKKIPPLKHVKYIQEFYFYRDIKNFDSDSVRGENRKMQIYKEFILQ